MEINNFSRSAKTSTLIEISLLYWTTAFTIYIGTQLLPETLLRTVKNSII